MAKAKFSQSTGGIYPLNVYKSGIPSDAIDIPADLYNKYKAQEVGLKVEGGVVVADLSAGFVDEDE